MRLVLPVVAVSIAIVAGSVASTPAGGQQSASNRGAETVQADCGSVSNQSDMNDCYAREAKRVQQLLDALVQELTKTLDPTKGQQLLNVQAKWVAYRDAHCGWQAKFSEGGSIQPTVYSNCMEGLAWDRIDELKYDLCEGWGMTGPCPASRRYDRPTETRK